MEFKYCVSTLWHLSSDALAVVDLGVDCNISTSRRGAIINGFRFRHLNHCLTKVFYDLISSRLFQKPRIYYCNRHKFSRFIIMHRAVVLEWIISEWHPCQISINGTLRTCYRHNWNMHMCWCTCIFVQVYINVREVEQQSLFRTFIQYLKVDNIIYFEMQEQCKEQASFIYKLVSLQQS